MPVKTSAPQIKHRFSASVVALALSWVFLTGFLLVWKFPFRRDAVVRLVENGTGAHVQIGTFHQKWFPPGFTAERVRLSARSGEVLSIAAVALTGSYSGLLRNPKAVTEIDASGLDLVIPAGRHPMRPGDASKGGLTVGLIRLANAQVSFLSEGPGKPPLTFMVRALELEHQSPGKPIAFHVFLHNPRPSGDIRADGQFGAVDFNNPGKIPVSGAFTFERADLSVPHGISGTLNASGRFHGRFGEMECTGTADVSRFQVSGSSHPVHVSTRFQTIVDARTGNAVLRSVVSHFNDTTVAATGKVTGTPDRPGKTVTLDLAIHDGRVEDLLLLFTNRSIPSMQGPVSLEGKFTIPPGPPDFLTRLKIDGAFQIAPGHFTNPKTQAPINRLSESAAGEPKRELAEDPRVVPATIRAAVSAHNGVALLHNIVLEAPGVRGQLDGTFTLHDRNINLNGTLQTKGKLSDTASGVKSLILKVAGPLWPRQASVQTIPFHIGGQASHPVFRLKLKD